MGFLTVATAFCLCISTAFATYGGSDFKPLAHNKHHYDVPNKHYDAHSKHHYDAPNKHFDGHNKYFDAHNKHFDGHNKYFDAHNKHYDSHDRHHYDGHKEPSIHLDSPKIILNRPSINVHEPAPAPLHEDEPIILAHDKPLYIRKSLHGIPAGPVVTAAHHPAPVPVLVDGGYSHAPIQVINHAPIVHERPILIRRPVVVSKGLTQTQDHLEKLHYAHSGLAHSGGYSYGEYAVPISKGLHERTVVYGGLAHGYGGHYAPAHYNAPLLVEQPRALLLEHPKAYGHSGIGYIGGAPLHGHGGHLHAAPLKKY